MRSRKSFQFSANLRLEPTPQIEQFLVDAIPRVWHGFHRNSANSLPVNCKFRRPRQQYLTIEKLASAPTKWCRMGLGILPHSNKCVFRAPNECCRWHVNSTAWIQSKQLISRNQTCSIRRNHYRRRSDDSPISSRLNCDSAFSPESGYRGSFGVLGFESG